jgi:PadR family transcriptional regulator
MVARGRKAGDVLPLTALSLAVLLAVAEDPLHGYAVMKRLEERPGPRLVAGAGSLYAALDRMLDEGLLRATPDSADTRRRRRFAITAFGREVVRAELERLQSEIRIARDVNLRPGHA